MSVAVDVTAPPLAATAAQSSAISPPSPLVSTLQDGGRSSQAAADIETSLSSLAAQLGGAVGTSSENLQTDFLSAFVQLLQTQVVCVSVTLLSMSLT